MVHVHATESYVSTAVGLAVESVKAELAAEAARTAESLAGEAEARRAGVASAIDHADAAVAVEAEARRLAVADAVEHADAAVGAEAAARKADLDRKQDALGEAQLEAVNSGITRQDFSDVFGEVFATIPARFSAVSQAMAQKQDVLSPNQRAAVDSGITSELVAKIGQGGGVTASEARNIALQAALYEKTELESVVGIQRTNGLNFITVCPASEGETFRIPAPPAKEIGGKPYVSDYVMYINNESDTNDLVLLKSTSGMFLTAGDVDMRAPHGCVTEVAVTSIKDRLFRLSVNVLQPLIAEGQQEG